MKAIFTSIDLTNSGRYPSIKGQMYPIHGIIYSSFPSKSIKKLFQCDDSSKEIRILSEVKPDKSHLAREFGIGINDVHCYDYTSRLSKMTNGSSYCFLFIGNPVKRITKTKSLVPLVGKDEYIRWLYRKASSGGFEIIDVDTVTNLPSKGKNNSFIHSVKFTGSLRITDEVLFRNLVLTGIGHSKGFGFGMMWIDTLI